MSISMPINVMTEPTVYLFSDWEIENIESILTELVKDITSNGNNDFVIIDAKHCLEGNIPAATTLSSYLMDTYRMFGNAKNAWMTVLNADDELCALQLCLADMNMQTTGDFDVPVSDVLTALQNVQQRKLAAFAEDGFLSENPDSLVSSDEDVFSKYQQFLNTCNYVDFYDIFNFYQKCSNTKDAHLICMTQKSFILLGLPIHLVEKAMVQFLCSTRKILQIVSENSLIDDSKDVKFHYNQVTSVAALYEDKLPVRTPKAVSSKLSSTHRYIYQVFYSYLDLLVNSRSQISLARVLNVPDRGLDHQAFTDLKREAKKSGLPMYQQAVSFIMKLRLGGKGYAPDSTSHLRMHVKGLSQFIDLLHKLQTVIEEDQNVRSACQRVINIIKNTILKSKESLSKKPALETAAEQLQSDISAVVDILEKTTLESPCKPANQGGSLCGRKSLQVLQKVLDKAVLNSLGMHSLNVLSDILCTQGTPIRFPSLISQFRSPDPELDIEEEKPLAQRLSQHKTEQNALLNTNKSHFDWASNSPNNQIPITEVKHILPSKTLMYPASGKKTAFAKLTPSNSTKDKENDPSILEAAQDILSPVTQPSKKSEATKRKKESDPKKAKQKCRRKLLPQIKGQTALTAFFKH
ncbi:PCNA-interacting partner-like isoform X1 [Octopus sinensis]|uniref:PCNA-interacting partner n=2 Tax=Octopus sinensis TaxID=2607531 RepID=A0A6P7S4B4_9MOLL|nr:PCNA-interacting partner-like isoform X1 [Octopus sinensis]